MGMDAVPRRALAAASAAAFMLLLGFVPSVGASPVHAPALSPEKGAPLPAYAPYPGTLLRHGTGSVHAFPKFPAGWAGAGTIPSAPSYCGMFGCGQLSYNGGPIMHNPTVYLVWWEPSGFSFDGGTDTYSVAAGDASYEHVLTGFFLNSTGSGYDQVVEQYTMTGGSHAGGTITLGREFKDTSPFPCGVCDASNPLSDTDLQNEVHKIATTYGTPENTNTEYFLFTPLGVQECSAAAGGCSAGDYTNPAFCAFHGDFSDGGNDAVYAYMWDTGSNPNDCQGWNDTVYPYTPSGDSFADEEVSIVSHEFAESMTDPDIGVNNIAWYNNQYGEIGDMCAYVYPGSGVFQDHPDDNFTFKPFINQPEYSNYDQSCSTHQNTYATGNRPLPSIVNVNYPATVAVGQSANIFVNVSNTGAQAQWGNLTLDFPTNPAVSTLSVVSPFTNFPATPTIVPSGTKLQACYSTCTITSGYPIVEAFSGQWPGSTTYRLQVRYTPTASGTFTFDLKAVMAAVGISSATDWVPLSNTLTDQQGENVTQYSITVSSTISAGAVTLNRTSCEVGCGVAVNATFTGGISTYSGAFCWNDGTGCTSFTGLASSPAFATHRYTVAGKTYSPNVFINDSAAHSIVEAPTTGVTVYTHVGVSALTPSLWHGPTPANETLSGGVASGGLAAYTYSWALAFGNTSTSASAPFQIYLRPGNYTSSVLVTDSLGYKASASVRFSVWGNSSLPLALSSGWNLIALPLSSNDYTLFELALELGGSTLGAPLLSLADLHGGTTTAYARGGPTGNTAVPAGDALWVDLSAPASLMTYGLRASSISGVAFTGSTWSGVGWSITGTTTASGLAALLGAPAGLTAVSEWNAATQSWSTYLYGFDSPGGQYDFTLTQGTAVYLWTWSGGTFLE